MSKFNFKWYSRKWLNKDDALLRKSEIVKRHKNGESFAAIGQSMGISKQRVSQIYREAERKERE